MDKILSCEKAYIECFSEINEENSIMTFTDELLKDMYDHNFFYVRSGANKQNVIDKLNQKFKELQKKGHCVVVFDSNYDEGQINEIANNTLHNMELEKYGCYVLDKTKIDTWKEREDCEVRMFTKNEMDDVIKRDIKMDAERLGEDFCIRRALRKGNIFINNKHINNYLLYYKNELIGSCELFIKDKIAKVEDFVVLEQYQRKGFGTTILKHVVRKALEEDADLIFLDTDEEDTVKEMYTKLGFSKIHENYKLIWADWME